MAKVPSKTVVLRRIAAHSQKEEESRRRGRRPARGIGETAHEVVDPGEGIDLLIPCQPFSALPLAIPNIPSVTMKGITLRVVIRRPFKKPMAPLRRILRRIAARENRS